MREATRSHNRVFPLRQRPGTLRDMLSDVTFAKNKQKSRQVCGTSTPGTPGTLDDIYCRGDCQPIHLFQGGLIMDDIHNDPTTFQRKIAKKLKIDISNDTQNVASARIYDAVQPAIDPGTEVRNATAKQVEFGRELGLDLKNDSLSVASAKIEDKLREKNKYAIKKLDLEPGDKVRKKRI